MVNKVFFTRKKDSILLLGHIFFITELTYFSKIVSIKNHQVCEGING